VISRLAYLAGIIDGEGHVSVVRRGTYFVPCVRVANTNETLIGAVKDILDDLEVGYCVSYYDRSERKNAKPSWTVCVEARARVPKLLNAVLPYLIAKLPQAEMVLAWCEFDGRRKSLTQEDRELITGIREANSRGVR
jgi:hypothetical protein